MLIALLTFCVTNGTLKEVLLANKKGVCFGSFGITPINLKKKTFEV